MRIIAQVGIVRGVAYDAPVLDHDLCVRDDSSRRANFQRRRRKRRRGCAQGGPGRRVGRARSLARHKKAGKEVGHEAKKAGQAVGGAAKEGAQELKRAFKGEK